MSKDPAFLFYPGDYLRDTQCLSEKAQVAYDRIMCEHMRNICIRQKQLNFFIKRLSDDEKEEIILTLTKIEGGYQIHWVAESIIKRRSYTESRRKNREGKTKIICKSYDTHMENENEDEDKREDKRRLYKEVVAHLNTTCSTNFSDKSKSTHTLINARLKEGRTLDDFKKVHLIKFKEWKGSDYEKFLRPETLYGNKFESYLQQSEKRSGYVRVG